MSASRSVLLVDIASSSIGVGLSGIREKALPELIFTARVPFAHSESFDFKLIEPAMMMALKGVLGAAFSGGTGLLRQRGYPAHLDHAIISFSSPWFVSELGTEEGELKTRLSEEYGEEMHVFEREGSLRSATQKKLVRKIEDEIIRTFGIERGIGVSSFSVVFSKVLNRAFQNLGPSLYADMTGHTTDILAHDGSAIRSAMSVPIGHMHLSRNESGLRNFWKQVEPGLPQEALQGNVFVIADNGQAPLLHKALVPVLPTARLIPFHTENDFLRDMAVTLPTARTNERLVFLAAYSNLFL